MGIGWVLVSCGPASPSPSPPMTMPSSESADMQPVPPAETAPESTAPEWAAPWSVVYADGSGNVSRIERPGGDAPVDFAYEPVTPEQSSSGTYSGGPPRSERLDPGDARIRDVWRQVERIEADLSIRTDARAKGTGALRITTPDGERSFIVVASPALEDMERILSGFGS